YTNSLSCNGSLFIVFFMCFISICQSKVVWIFFIFILFFFFFFFFFCFYFFFLLFIFCVGCCFCKFVSLLLLCSCVSVVFFICVFLEFFRCTTNPLTWSHFTKLRLFAHVMIIWIVGCSYTCSFISWIW